MVKLLKIISNRSMLERGGNAVDAALAALFCNGVVKSMSSGIGGGFMMTIRLIE